ncbi:MAG TPA: hypothetical protein VKT80_00795 [Chloroflexota bacterium]|nr:hypothetical protein [Chloroflexota bacterium]
MSPSPPWARLYYNVSLVECDTPDVLDELMTVPELARFVLRRVSDRAILVDGRQRTQLSRALARRGQPHRIVDAPSIDSETFDEGGQR